MQNNTSKLNTVLLMIIVILLGVLLIMLLGRQTKRTTDEKQTNDSVVINKKVDDSKNKKVDDSCPGGPMGGVVGDDYESIKKIVANYPTEEVLKNGEYYPPVKIYGCDQNPYESNKCFGGGTIYYNYYVAEKVLPGNATYFDYHSVDVYGSVGNKKYSCDVGGGFSPAPCLTKIANFDLNQCKVVYGSMPFFRMPTN
ncbi:MAG: hypothetical protein WC059_01320 [Candidatus Paceibacterota bacterium]